MSKFRLDPDLLSVTSFEPLAPSANASTTIIFMTPAINEAIRTQYETNEQICWCNTWVAEDCFGPTAGSECSTGEGGVAAGDLAV